ncbi:SLBB domain-containing protein [Pedosphaera parvula]|uniref:Polysaccharide export protein n=1 Tax=Pedosphaera parvula (strain Ellin514) TaxID=320771 RepID=B9X9K9_PEDPL|nr:SLBB domain-containing protein [Pedosphaera parvula]EEF63253.1 polysaccharide export protein [Pedosphaera parvula Ellin514]
MSNHNDLNMGGLLQIDHYGPSDPPAEPGNNSHSKNRQGSMSEKSSGKSRTRKETAPPPPTVDAWIFLEVLLQKWKPIVLTGFIVATIGFLCSFFLLHRTYMATATLMRYQPTITGQFFNPPVLTPDTFAALLKSPELLQMVSTNSRPSVSTEVLNKAVFIKTEPESDIVKVGVKAFNPEVAVNLANLYASNAERFTLELQRREAGAAVENYFREQLTFMESNISNLEDQVRRTVPGAGVLVNKLNQMQGSVSNLNHQAQLPMTASSSLSMSRSFAKLQQAKDELDKLLVTLTPANPRVQAAQELVNAYEKDYALAATNSATGSAGSSLLPAIAAGTGGPLVNPEYDIILRKLQAIDASRQQLEDRKREAEAFQKNPPGNVKHYSFATLKNITPDKRWLKVSLATVFGGILGLIVAIAGVLIVEVADDRLKTAADVNRVTKLPVIATLDDLGKKGPSAQERWAFRTWTMLQGRLSPSAHQGLVCGITSSNAGEGRSTWINMLAEAASMSGFRVLTIATRSTVSESENVDGETDGKAKSANPDQKPVNGSENNAGKLQSNGHAHGSDTSTALNASALTSPGEVTQQLTGPDPQPLVHIPLPGWVWNLERRKQWQEALSHWQQIDNLVILVELPPASMSEAVLLGENLPNLLWLAESGKADAAETRSQLETLRHARCNLVGAVLNREPGTPLKSRFPRWLGCLALFLGLSVLSAHAQAEGTNTLFVAPTSVVQVHNTNETDVEVANTNVSFSLINPANRGGWQKHLTLGPGDVLSFLIYGQPETARSEVFIGPDGRIGYLEAQNILAAGLTIDELRTNIDNELSKYRRAPRTIITPVSFMSKRYYMLGKVVQRGVYTLDRPLTVLEAVARAHGLETGLSDRNTLDLADFERSFLMRGGKRFPLNFEKLFGQGDLSQNIPIEPDDYIFFPSAILQEVYVLGEVRLPGVVPYTSDMTVIGALSARGGFAEKAYKSRVMVIRGSLNHPQAFVVDTRAILDARGQDFQLQSKDIIYVTDRPFSRVEDLLELGITAFLQSMTAQWAGRNIGPLIGTPFIPDF